MRSAVRSSFRINLQREWREALAILGLMIEGKLSCPILHLIVDDRNRSLAQE